MGDLEGYGGLKARLRALESGTADRRILGELGLLAVQYSKEEQRPHKRTGALARTIRLGDIDVTGQRVQVLAGGHTVGIGVSGPSAVGYAAVHEFGSEAHIIRPRRRKALAWAASPEGRRLTGSTRTATRRGAFGGMRFAKVVHHPGTRAYPYLFPGARRALHEVGLRDIVIQVWNQAA